MTEKKATADSKKVEEGHLLLEDEANVSSLEKIYEVFAASAKRWEAIVYPSMFAFIILAVYGFYLIFSLTMDVDKVVGEMKIISSNMVQISGNINTMSGSVATMSTDVKAMTTSVGSMDSELSLQLVEMQQLNKNFSSMNRSVHIMTVAVNQMTRDMSVLNNNVSRPMNFMNSFMPW
jgi:methyl-accepting chemotaxis protein